MPDCELPLLPWFEHSHPTNEPKRKAGFGPNGRSAVNRLYHNPLYKLLKRFPFICLEVTNSGHCLLWGSLEVIHHPSPLASRATNEIALPTCGTFWSSSLWVLGLTRVWAEPLSPTASGHGDGSLLRLDVFCYFLCWRCSTIPFSFLCL